MRRPFDQGELSHAALQLPEAGVHKLLALLGHVVFGIFRQIAERHGFLDLRRQLVRQLVFELGDLFLKLVSNVIGHRVPWRDFRGTRTRERVKILKFHYRPAGNEGTRAHGNESIGVNAQPLGGRSWSLVPSFPCSLLSINDCRMRTAAT